MTQARRRDRATVPHLRAPRDLVSARAKWSEIRSEEKIYSGPLAAATAAAAMYVLLGDTTVEPDGLRWRRVMSNEPQATVIVVDDDASVRDAVGSLLRSVGLQVKLHATVTEFLKAGRPANPACLVLDVRLPGISGLDLQRDLAAAGTSLPIVFITGHGDIPMTVEAMKGGAIEFLTKPFRDQDLLDAVQAGLARDRARLQAESRLADLRARFETLTPREREVMALVAAGRLNKQIAGDLGISEITAKVHRGQVMRKMRASSLPDLARMADKLNLTAQKA